jgi:hypothetical protein
MAKKVDPTVNSIQMYPQRSASSPHIDRKHSSAGNRSIAASRGGERAALRNKLTHQLMRRRLQASRSAGAPSQTNLCVGFRRRSEHACNCVLNEAEAPPAERCPWLLWTFHACSRDRQGSPCGQVVFEGNVVDVIGTAILPLDAFPFDMHPVWVRTMLGARRCRRT